MTETWAPGLPEDGVRPLVPHRHDVGGWASRYRGRPRLPLERGAHARDLGERPLGEAHGREPQVPLLSASIPRAERQAVLRRRDDPLALARRRRRDHERPRQMDVERQPRSRVAVQPRLRLGRDVRHGQDPVRRRRRRPELEHDRSQGPARRRRRRRRSISTSPGRAGRAPTRCTSRVVTSTPRSCPTAKCSSPAAPRPAGSTRSAGAVHAAEEWDPTDWTLDPAREQHDRPRLPLGVAAAARRHRAARRERRRERSPHARPVPAAGQPRDLPATVSVQGRAANDHEPVADHRGLRPDAHGDDAVRRADHRGALDPARLGDPRVRRRPARQHAVVHPRVRTGQASRRRRTAAGRRQATTCCSCSIGTACRRRVCS